jgi:uncharacterized protein
MPKLPSRFRRLDEALADLPLDEPMLLTELDGFLTGMLVCPELIMPSEWLPIIWGEGEGAPFDDPADVQLFSDMVMARYNEIVRDLGRRKLQPVFDVDERNGDVLWEMWVDGFETAMALRPGSWSSITESGDEEGRTALAEMLMFIEVASGESGLMSYEINDLSDEAPGRIAAAVAALHAWRLRSGGRERKRREGRPQRGLPVRIGEEVQAVLRVELSYCSTGGVIVSRSNAVQRRSRFGSC